MTKEKLEQTIETLKKSQKWIGRDAGYTNLQPEDLYSFNSVATLIKETISMLEVELRTQNIANENRCVDCRNLLPDGHPYGYCPARQDDY